MPTIVVQKQTPPIKRRQYCPCLYVGLFLYNNIVTLFRLGKLQKYINFEIYKNEEIHTIFKIWLTNTYNIVILIAAKVVFYMITIAQMRVILPKRVFRQKTDV